MHPIVDVPASKNIEVSEGIANVPPIVEAGEQNKETQQSKSNNADKNSNSGIPSNVEEEEVSNKNKASHESNSNTSPKDLEGSVNNAIINPIAPTPIQVIKALKP